MSLAAFSQGPFTLEKLLETFRSYTQKMPREEIFVQTDRNEYIGGEDIWFSIFAVDRQNMKPSQLSRIAYFEILNPDNRPVVQKRIILNRGYGPGQCVLPDSLRPGKYILRAYTAWMKNFMPDNCFSKEISVYNALSNDVFRIPAASRADIASAYKSALQAEGVIRVMATVDNTLTEAVTLNITSDESWRNENGSQCFMLVQTHGNLDYSSLVRLVGPRTSVQIPRTKLGRGVNEVVLLGQNGRIVFRQNLLTLNEKKSYLKVVSPDTIQARDKAGLSIVSAGADDLKGASVTVSVAPGPAGYPGIDDYLLFGSEYGDMPWKFLAGRKVAELGSESVDSLMKILRSSWIDWNIILKGSFPKTRWQPENEFHILNGRLIPQSSVKNLKDRFVTVSVPGRNARFQYGKCDAAGNFTIAVPVDEELHDMIIQPDADSQEDKVVIVTSFSEKYPELRPAKDSAGFTVPSYTADWSVNYQVSRIYESSALGDPLLRPIAAIPDLRFYGTPDFQLIMDDYIKLPVMEEVFFELIPGAFLKKKKSGYEIAVSNPVDGRIYEVPPVLMIDGVIIHDPNIIGEMDPEIVEKIDLVRERYFVGEYVFYGLINVITRRGDFEGFSLPGSAVRLPYRVAEPVWLFRSPDYSSFSSRNNRIPDFRNTAFWSSFPRAAENGSLEVSFFAPDVKGSFGIDVQGFNPDGKLISVHKEIVIR